MSRVEAPRRYRTVDYHTAGEPFRIVVDGAPAIPGTDVPSRRMTAIGSAEVQQARALLCSEPRGHADMYGCFLVPPNDAGADLGTLFWHKDGFSTACGHGTIALATYGVDSGLVPAPADGETEVVIDVPSGRVRAQVRTVGGRVASVAFVNVPSWVMDRDVQVQVGDRTAVVDIVFGGAAYACLPAASLGLAVTSAHYQELIAAGRAIRNQLNAVGAARHPDDDRLSGIYGTILYDELDPALLDPSVPSGAVWQRNVTVFADGEVDRSPCGSGTSARVAALAADGRLAGDTILVHDSIIGTRFTARVLQRSNDHGRPTVIAEVVGSAYRTAECTFVVDPDDPVSPGFVLR